MKKILNLFKIAVATFTAALIIVSCSKKDEEPLSSDNILKSFDIQMSNNPQLKQSCYGVICGNIIYITVPQGQGSLKFVPTYNNGNGSHLVIGQREILSGIDETTLPDNSSVISVAPDGTTTEYTLLVREGDTRIDHSVYQLMKDYSIPGVSLCITENEELSYSAGYGYADVENRVRTLPTHLFRLASMSKCQTSMCVMKVIEDGRLSITDKVFGENGILKDEFPGPYVSGADRVTIQDLLEHTSGWKSDPDPMFTSDKRFYGKSLNERIKYVIGNVKQTYQPGTKYSYYNLGFGILGKVIEKVSGQPYELFLKEKIHAPLGITNIHVGGDRSGKRADEVVYYSQDGTNGYGNDMEVIAAAGGLIASGTDLMKLMCGVDYGTKVPDILKKETLDLMYTPSAAYSRYAKGWRVNYPVNNHWASYHSGNLAGTGVLWVRGNNGKNAVILCNSRSYKDGFDDALYTILLDVI